MVFRHIQGLKAFTPRALDTVGKRMPGYAWRLSDMIAMCRTPIRLRAAGRSSP